MKKIISILSHCNDDEKIKKLRDNISLLREKTNLPIILNSHITLPQDIINTVDFFIYDNTNPILKYPFRALERWSTHVMGERKIKLSSYIPDYGWTPFNKIKNTINFLNGFDYDKVFFMNYDLLISEDLIDEIQNQEDNMFFNVKTDRGEFYLPGLIAFDIKYSDLKNWINFLSIKKYCDYNIAEDYLRFFVSLQNHKIYPDYIYDSIRYESHININNNSPYPTFSLFVDMNTNKEEENLFIYSITENITIMIDNEIVNLKPNFNYLYRKPNKIYLVKGDDIEEIKLVNLYEYQRLR